MFKRTKFLAIGLLVLALVVSGCGAVGTKDLTQGKTAEEILKDAYKISAEAKSMDMDISMKMKFSPSGSPPMEMAMTGKATLFQEPLLMKMEMEMIAEGQTINMYQYMEEASAGLVIYQSVDGQWFKMTLDDPLLAEVNSMDPSQNINLFMENLVSASIIGEEKILEKDTLKIEMVASSQMYEEMMQQLPTGDFVTGQLPLDAGILSKMGDIKGVVWIDKNTLDIVKTAMDLTDNLRNLGNAFGETGVFPKEALEMFNTMEMSMEYLIYNINQAQSFTIPAEAKQGMELAM